MHFLWWFVKGLVASMQVYNCYNLIAKEFHTDIIGAKETVCRYIEDLKERIDNSDDEKTKLFWYEEFSYNPYPDPDEFIALLFVIGENPFIPVE